MTWGYQHILVALDLEKDNETLINKAASLAAKFGAKLSLLHVDCDYSSMPVGFYSLHELQMQVVSHHRILALKEQCDYPIEGVWVRHGEFQAQCQRVIEKQGVDLVVCGRHHHYFLNKWMSGTMTLVHHSEVDILVVPLDE